MYTAVHFWNKNVVPWWLIFATPMNTSVVESVELQKHITCMPYVLNLSVFLNYPMYHKIMACCEVMLGIHRVSQSTDFLFWYRGACPIFFESWPIFWTRLLKEASLSGFSVAIGLDKHHHIPTQQTCRCAQILESCLIWHLGSVAMMCISTCIQFHEFYVNVKDLCL